MLRYRDIVAGMTKRRLPSRAGMILTTVALPRALHRRLAIAALDLESAGAEVMRQAIEQFLDRHESRAGRSTSRAKGGRAP